MDRRIVTLALIAACASTLALGLVGGVLVARLAARGGLPGRAPRFERAITPPDGPPLELLGRTLDLTPEQHTRIASLIDSSRHELRATRDSLRVRIERELTPAQRERWRAWTRRAPRPPFRRWDGPREGAPPGPPEEGEPR